MTIGADGNFGIAGGEALAVNAGVVLAQLIGAQAGIELPHVRGIGVAASAQLRDLFAIDLPFPSLLGAHGLIGIVAGRIASVATDAGQALLCVYVLAEFLRSHAQGVRQRRVAIQAGVLSLREGKRAEQQEGCQ